MNPMWTLLGQAKLLFPRNSFQLKFKSTQGRGWREVALSIFVLLCSLALAHARRRAMHPSLRLDDALDAMLEAQMESAGNLYDDYEEMVGSGHV